MRLGKSSPQKTPEKKSATPYKNMSGNQKYQTKKVQDRFIRLYFQSLRDLPDNWN